MTESIVLLWCLVGAALVGGTARIYGGADAVALTVVGLIAAGLLAGAVELWRRARGARLVCAELAGLPRPAEVAALEAASPRIAPHFDAARAGRPCPPAAAIYTPYLLGLLVMLGMLGTFLGLVDTFAGARALIAEAPDIATLRESLGAPVRGLVRAFGTSVAGVSASAALGVASLFVRRVEQRARRALAAYVAGPMAALTPVGRELAALEKVAADGAAVPQVVAALESAVERIGAAVAAGFASTGQQVERAVAAVAERATDAASAAASARLDDWSARLSAEVDARREAEGAHLAALGGTVTALADRLAGQVERIEATRAARAEEAAGLVERVDAEFARHLGALGDRLSAPLVAAAEAAVDQVTRFEAVIARLESAAAALDGYAAQQAARAGALEQQIERAVSAQAAQLTDHARGLGDRLDAVRGVVGEAAELLRAGGAELSAVAEMFADGVDRYRESSEQWLASLNELEVALGSSGHEEAGRLVGEYLDQTREVFGDAMRFQRELFNELRALRDGGAS